MCRLKVKRKPAVLTAGEIISHCNVSVVLPRAAHKPTVGEIRSCSARNASLASPERDDARTVMSHSPQRLIYILRFHRLHGNWEFNIQYIQKFIKKFVTSHYNIWIFGPFLNSLTTPCGFPPFLL